MTPRPRLAALAIIVALGTAPLALATLAAPAHAQKARAQNTSSFAAFLASLWPEAQAAGVSRRTFEAALGGLSPDSSILVHTRKQSEFVKPIWSYMDSAISRTRLARGEEAAQQYAGELARFERKYGVDKRAVLGIWGMETNFGSFTGGKDVIRSLATLAYARYRDDFFRNELILALQILEQGHVARADMRGSWAGAMGQTQFMPSSFTKFAVDGDGDGLKDIWSTVPDALASTANYLRMSGWKPGIPWGVEVELPEGFDLARAQGWAEFSSWSRAGVTRAGGGNLPRNGEAMLYLPAGIHGPALLVTENYRVIKKYNSSDAYALGVAHLGDRIFGAGGMRKSWPRHEKRLSVNELMEVQRHLKAKGLPIGTKVDGRIGEISRDSVKKAQAQHGLPADGYPTLALLQRLRQNR